MRSAVYGVSLLALTMSLPAYADCAGDIAMVEQQLEVGAVVAVAAGPASAEDPRRAPEHVDRETGVIGQRGQAGRLGQRDGLQPGVLLEGHAVLDDVRRVGELACTDNLETELVAHVGQDVA